MAEKIKLAQISRLGKIDIDKIRSQRRSEEDAWLAENKARLIEQYGIDDNFSNEEVLKIKEYEKTSAICENCTGLPCQKKIQPTIKEKLKIDNLKCRIYEYFCTCKFENARRNLEKIKRNFKSANISADYLEKSFADYKVDADNKKAVETAKKLLTGEQRGAYFYGAFGTGKTFLSVLTAKAFVKKGKSVLFYKVPFLVKDLQDALFDKANPFHESELLKQICEVDVLILDDFGMSGKITTYAAGRLSMIIDARYENSDLKTIITSNLTLKNLQEKLDNPSDASDSYSLDGSRIADRLKAMCVSVKFGGESRR